MRVSWIIPTLGPGGAENVMSLLACGFADRGVESEVTTVVGTQEDDFYKVPGVARTTLDLGDASETRLRALYNIVKRVAALRRAIRRSGPDVVISFLTETNVLTFLSCMGLGMRTVLSEHTDPDRCPLRLEWKILRAACYPAASAIVVPNAYIGSRFGRWIQPRIRVIPNPVAPTLKGVESVGIAAKPLILSIGRMTQEKNHELLLEAFRRFRSEFRDWKLVIVGDGPYRSETMQHARRLGIEADVSFPGLVQDPWSEYGDRCGMFVLSSNYEGFPLALCEALSVGVPVISTRYNEGVTEIVEDGVNGLLVPVRDAHALVKAMGYLAESPERRRSMGREARNSKDRYDVNRIVEMWLNVCKSLPRANRL